WRQPFIFFFQAEDGIRDGHVTGVQTCALPISLLLGSGELAVTPASAALAAPAVLVANLLYYAMGFPVQSVAFWADSVWSLANSRSEERRVGKECRFRWAAEH